jgi:hypothetical protein
MAERLPRSLSWYTSPKDEDRSASFLERFGEHIHEVQGWSISSGPITALLAETSNADAAWEMFWRVVRDFARDVQGSF